MSTVHNRGFCAAAVLWMTASGALLATPAGAADGPSPLAGERSGPDTDAWFRFLARVNKYSALEPAGSRGSIGMGLGAGVVADEAPGSALAQGQLHAAVSGESEAKPFYLPKIWLAKGLPWPVDFGVTAASATGHFTQAGGYAQVTAFEALAWPAVTLRASYARLFGLADTEFQSYGLDGVLSYGFLRYFTVYGILGETRHQARLAWSPSEQTALGYALADGDGPDGVVTRTWLDPTRAVGLKLMVWPPFVSVTTEAEWVEGEPRHYAAKLTLGM